MSDENTDARKIYNTNKLFCRLDFKIEETKSAENKYLLFRPKLQKFILTAEFTGDTVSILYITLLSKSSFFLF